MALSARDKRAVTILGGIAGAALVVFVLMNVLGGGGGEEAAPMPPDLAAGGPPAQPSPTATPSTPRETLPPVVLAGARDPFSPPPILVSPGGGVSPIGTSTGGTTSTGGATSPDGSTSTDGSTSMGGSTSTGGSTGPTSSPTAPGGGASASMGGHTVVLVDIFDGGAKAQVEVDGTIYTVNEGDAFGDHFHLTSIAGSCARVQFGDEVSVICLNPQK
jgi:hypothetical protein